VNEVERRLNWAIQSNADPKKMSPSGTCFAWRPVYGWDYKLGDSRWIWLERVNWFKPLGLLTEYKTYAGSETEYRAKHGKYSWES